LKSRSRFRVTARSQSVTRTHFRNDPDNRLDVEAETEARVSVKIQGVKKILSISGPGLWATVELTNGDAIRLGRKLAELTNMKNGRTGEQVVFFPRKAKVEV
jgi:hypothetical protein